jgi:hypothetical protein
MSTHSTLTWLATREHKGGQPSGEASVDVATDTMIDQCVRLSVTEGGSLSSATMEAEAHLTPEQAEIVGRALIEGARIVRGQPGHDPRWAGETTELEGWRP